ncbi:MAG: tRNA uridine(34) 5-carboxymethylaminomethyl modification radical SAM/GNAT enzyme Elp3 [Candidatus Paceibacterota bacterium]
MNTNELIIKELLKTRTPEGLASAKRKIAKSCKVPCPSNISLLREYHRMVEGKRTKKNEELEKLLKTRPVRSLSGIVNVSVLSKPYECPGKCIYCPEERNIPKSYLSGEPAVERAKRLKYDPYSQVKKRIEVLEMSGHPADKIELRVIGGTWSYYDTKYKNWFVKRCFEAANGQKGKTLEQVQKKNEKAKHRIIGLSFETRPDFINEKEIEEMRKLGATKIELGVQSIYDDVLKINKRGHDIEKTIEATEMLRDAGFKVAYQMMLNLPGSNPKRDIKMFKELFDNPAFRPEYLKIYPCALTKEAPLYKLYLKKQYKPYDEKTLIETIKKIKKIVPLYVRIERIIRDIPSPSIVEGGAKTLNLRQMIKTEGLCRCIRCREIKDDDVKEKIYLFKEEYDASKGKEIFLSFEDENRKRIYSLLRLRIKDGKAIIREVHVYGQAASISKRDSKTQHKGLGQKMIKEAERIVKKEKIKELKIISGVGARDYYRSKLGYKLKDGYMVKTF